VFYSPPKFNNKQFSLIIFDNWFASLLIEIKKKLIDILLMQQPQQQQQRQ
jgi:hypothetical protein